MSAEQATPRPTDEEVIDCLREQLDEMIDETEEFLLVMPEGTTDEQYKRCLAICEEDMSNG